MPERLPIYEVEPAILQDVRAHGRLIISAPTGSGKSTQVPQMLLDGGLLGKGQVVILQPRRLAARLLARRVASERNSKLGGEVGYQIRFENVTSPATRIRYVTEGVLLRQMLETRTLPDVAAIIFDEFHERHLYGDITLAQALDLQITARPDLKILVMSATLDAQRLEEYLHPCRVLESAGRVFPVETRWAANPSYIDKRPVWEQAAEVFSDYVSSGGEGDVLVFMPGSFEISQTISAIRASDASHGFILLPLHGELPPDQQDAAVARHEKRKVVVATNVAETSLTIDGVRCVIDSGLARIPRYDHTRGINTLLVEKISQASAEQRAGRAGRTAPGTCIRLWSHQEHGHRPAQELPEVKRLDLAEVVLTLKASGVQDLRKFRWLEPPEEASLAHAEELLTDLGALRKDSHGSADALVRHVGHSGAPGGQECPRSKPGSAEHTVITPVGRKILAFPLHPRYSRMLLAASDFGCVYQACLVAALTQGRDLLLRNVDRATFELREDLLGTTSSSDFWLLMRAWNYALKNDFRIEACRRLGIHMVTARQVGPLFDQFVNIAKREGLDVARREVPDTTLQKCVLAAFSDRLARRLDSGTLRCELVHGRTGVLARESVVQKSELLVAGEIREVEGREKSVSTLLSLATAVEQSWVLEMFPEDLSTSLDVSFDSTARRVYAEEQLQFRGLSIGSRKIEPPPLEQAARLLAQEILAGRLRLENWDHAVDQWILRLNLLSKHCPELEIPPLSEADKADIVAELCHGSFTYKDVKSQPVKPVVQGWVSAAQRDLIDKHAPERLTLSNGKTPKIVYDEANPPHVAVRIQELYGVTATPRIAMGRMPVLLHILAPNMRPVQITQDLAGFWRDHYPKVKQELQRKYPKHAWK
jgi:ATP-dependent helicase HrpB